jgi:hypothetical protein
VPVPYPALVVQPSRRLFEITRWLKKRLERSSVKAEIVSLSKELSEKSVHNLLLGHIHHHLPKIGDRSIQPFSCSAGNNVTQYTRVLKRAEAKSSTFIKRETPALR